LFWALSALLLLPAAAEAECDDSDEIEIDAKCPRDIAAVLA